MLLRCKRIAGAARPGGRFSRPFGIVVPAYNEARHLPQVLAACRAAGPEVVVVVDDCSGDDTRRVMAEQLASWPGAPGSLRYLRNDQNLGKQGAVRRGLRALGSRPLFGVALIDGDGQHDPRELPRLARALEEHHLVIGARSQRQMPLHRRLSNGLVRLGYLLIGGLDFVDVQSGLRLYRKELADLLAARLPERGGYSLEHESLAVMARHAGRNGRRLTVGIAEATCAYGLAESSMRPGHVLGLARETVRQALEIRLVLQGAPAEAGR